MILSQRYCLGCIVFFFTAVSCFTSISNAAVWISGSKTADQTGVYGTKGVPSPSNVPGARGGSVSWTDSNGNLWLFGGSYSTVQHGLIFSDLWKYSCQSPAGDLNGDFVVDTEDMQIIAGDWLNDYTLSDFAIISANWLKHGTYMWTWISGPGTANYGTQGVPAPANIPGARQDSISWIDVAGCLWLFGGYSFMGSLNDLWRFDPATGLWTWMSGSNTAGQSGVYGTLGQPDALNIPGARTDSISWIDSNGNLWLFGGNIRTSKIWDPPYYLNDLWKYSPSTGFWTWMSGSSTTNQSGLYGPRGIPTANAVPGARYGSVAWIDNSNNLWLFGGFGYAAGSDIGGLNDLWKYNPSTGRWTWMSGSNVKGQIGVYGTKGVSDPTNIPGARGGSVGWTDSGGDFWLFGGVYNLNVTSYKLNDLWQYTPSTDLWTWMSGTNLTNRPGIYGTKGIPSSANVPGARIGDVSWFHDNDLWLFGGYGYDITGYASYLNDLWRFTCEGDPGDLNGDCAVDMDDLGILAQNWLDDYALANFKQMSGSWYKQSYPD